MKKSRSKRRALARAQAQAGGGSGDPPLAPDAGRQPHAAVPSAAESGRPRAWGFDPWRLAGALVHGAPWLLAGGLGLGLGGFLYGWQTAECVLRARLIHNQRPALLNSALASGTFRPKEPAAETLIEAMKSSDVLRPAATNADWALTPEELGRRLEISPEAGAEFLELRVRGRNAEAAARVANQLAAEAVRLSRALQAEEFSAADASLQSKLATLDQELVQTRRALIEFERAHGSVDYDRETLTALKQQEELAAKAQDARLQLETIEAQLKNLAREIAQQDPSLVAAKAALAKALERYTDEHPKVLQLRAALAAAEAEAQTRGGDIPADIAAWASPLANALYQQVVELRNKKLALDRQLQETEAARTRLQQNLEALPETQLACARIKSQYESLQAQRERLAQYQRDCQLLADNAVGTYRVFQPASAADAGSGFRLRGGLRTAAGAGLVGIFLAGLLLLVREVADGRIRSERDLQRVTRLPLLATLGDLAAMSEREKELWAFRALKLLKGKLGERNDQALVCGLTSANSGEGRSTWVRLLADAARREGNQVLVIPSGPDGRGGAEPVRSGPAPAPGSPPFASGPAVPFPGGDALIPHTPQALAPFSYQDWVWDPDHRERWQELLQQWDALRRVVVLVELPPASTPEAILLAERLPKVVWVCAKDMAKASETRAYLEVLRHSRCQLVGTVFNRATGSPWRRRFACLAGGAVVALWLAPRAFAAESANTNTFAPAALNPHGSVSISSPDQLADWQKRLTLGPGDVMDISLYEEADSARTGLFIGPDGRLNYLEARDVEAVGLTVDELRKRLEDVLGKYHRFPRVVIRPVAYTSKKYYVLGNVLTPGVYSLDRPVTLVEAIARAKGFVTGVQHRNFLVQADLPRSFLVRSEADGASKRIPVDFEALLMRGDLGQNLGLAPGDYLYFPPLDVQEVYVLGEVRSPGVTPFTKGLSAVAAIATRGGFSERAWKSKVLVVRGALNSPQTFVVDVAGVLKARAKDFPLQNKDIIYVSRRPFVKVEELTEAAITSFVDGMVYGWVQGPLMQKLPQP